MRTMAYLDREDAGRVLAGELEAFATPPCVVLGIPRGGVMVAAPVAARLDAPLGVVYVRKLTLPGAPEFAIGALDEDGHATVDAALLQNLGARADDLAAAKALVAGEIRRQRRAFGGSRPAPSLTHATVILVDDGLATGRTMQAAVAHVRRHGAHRILVAVPCASRSAADAIARAADRLVCPWIDEEFGAVGAYYMAFPPVRDAEVLAALDRAWERRAPGPREDAVVGSGAPAGDLTHPLPGGHETRG